MKLQNCELRCINTGSSQVELNIYIYIHTWETSLLDSFLFHLLRLLFTFFAFTVTILSRATLSCFANNPLLTWNKFLKCTRLITYEIPGKCRTVIDYFLIRKNYRELTRDVKVIRQEAVASEPWGQRIRPTPHFLEHGVKRGQGHRISNYWIGGSYSILADITLDKILFAWHFHNIWK